MESTFYLMIMDTVKQEGTAVVIKGQSKVALVLSRLPEHKVVVSLENLGQVIDENDFLKELNDEGNGLHFGERT